VGKGRRRPIRRAPFSFEWATSLGRRLLGEADLREELLFPTAHGPAISGPADASGYVLGGIPLGLLTRGARTSPYPQPGSKLGRAGAVTYIAQEHAEIRIH
jgi:hypothetical protein